MNTNVIRRSPTSYRSNCLRSDRARSQMDEVARSLTLVKYADQLQLTPGRYQ
ncbi:hypothetical protein [Stenomitos frigidus]|uniref:hypothetical protein n=1 Tax=Stenomitos frigidus TaxID=1886765 RepID=UPI0015E71B78|nr:hypothetical protein [Stenomitos frigidus]